ncbi:MAG: Ig-like domain-containing protein [Fusobacteria bacterium]|nr:Ig-like domain-containing protein [Fusobacteriota bacterium]
MYFKKKLYSAIFVLGILLLFGCGEKENKSLIDIEIIGLEYSTIKKGETYKLVAQKYYANGVIRYDNATWGSSNSKIVRVNDDGLIKALEVTGDTPIIITAKEDRLIGTKEIYVIE